MIAWLANEHRWLRWLLSLLMLVLFGWLAYMAWVSHRDFRIMSSTISHQFEVLKTDHVRAEVAMKMLASQVSRNTTKTNESTEALKKLPDELK